VLQANLRVGCCQENGVNFRLAPEALEVGGSILRLRRQLCPKLGHKMP
jgi:hypothetical protein